MTISYSDNFGKLLLRWKGSLWKSVKVDVAVFLTIYYAINLTFRFGMNENQKEYFRTLVDYCEKATSYIPLTFLLGFFVASIVSRWWEQFNCISRPDKFMTFVTTSIRGNEYLLLRRTIARWLNLSSALCWRDLSLRTIKRFPTIKHFVTAGLMTEDEFVTFDSVQAPYGKWWLPLIWICNLLKKCHDEKAIDSTLFKVLMKELMAFRRGFAKLIAYNWISIPLVYTQVVAIATYGYFGICLIARQIVRDPDLYVPIFTILQFLFYMGWLKVGQALMNPFGEDDDDFELNYILDRNVQIAYMLADEIHGQFPVLEKDVFWGLSNPTIPHTKASSKKPDIIFKSHLSTAKISNEDMTVIQSNGQESWKISSNCNNNISIAPSSVFGTRPLVLGPAFEIPMERRRFNVTYWFQVPDFGESLIDLNCHTGRSILDHNRGQPEGGTHQDPHKDLPVKDTMEPAEDWCGTRAS